MNFFVVVVIIIFKTSFIKSPNHIFCDLNVLPSGTWFDELKKEF
jgi:hypothetical protein